jgi:hypothetical protein
MTSNLLRWLIYSHAAWLRLLSFLLISIPVPASASVLIPISARKDHVFDNAHNLLYISTSDGSIQRYDIATNSLLSPFEVDPGQFRPLAGIDVTRDGKFIYVADTHDTATQFVFHKFNTETGVQSDLFCDKTSSSEDGAWDIAVTNDGNAIVTTGSFNSLPMRRLDLTTDTFSGEIRHVRHNTDLFRSASGNLVFFLEPSASNGPMGVYDPATQS